MSVVDLRSDTVTQPTEAMREAGLEMHSVFTLTDLLARWERRARTAAPSSRCSHSRLAAISTPISISTDTAH